MQIFNAKPSLFFTGKIQLQKRSELLPLNQSKIQINESWIICIDNPETN